MKYEKFETIPENEMIHYVYEHSLDGEVFYIGKGIKNRACDLISRSPLWIEYVNGREREVSVEIVALFENDKNALMFEESLIRKYTSSGLNLCNVTHNPQEDIKKKASLARSNLKEKSEEVAEEIHHGTKISKGSDSYKKKIDKIKLMKEDCSNIKIPAEYLNSLLTKEDKIELCKILNLRKMNGKIVPWKIASKIIEENTKFYVFDNKQVYANGRFQSASIIRAPYFYSL